MVNLLEIDEELYAPFVVDEKGEWVMYIELLKALYGSLHSAQLFWGKLCSKLIDDWGFIPNSYDSCVVNKMLDGKQLTVVWHMDDLKVSHVDKDTVENFCQYDEG